MRGNWRPKTSQQNVGNLQRTQGSSSIPKSFTGSPKLSSSSSRLCKMPRSSPFNPLHSPQVLQLPSKPSQRPPASASTLPVSTHSPLASHKVYQLPLKSPSFSSPAHGSQSVPDATPMHVLLTPPDHSRLSPCLVHHLGE